MFSRIQAWDVKYEEMIKIEDLYWFELCGIHDFSGHGSYSDYIFRLFTGLYDSTGKEEVYHKDIVEYEDWLYVVEWDNVETGFYLADYKYLDDPDSEEHLKGSCITQSVKVGNVFQDLELIKY